MILYVNGQDINYITFGVLGTPGEPPIRTVHVGPEEHLKELVDFLDDNNTRVADIKQIVAVVGPGSATSLRTSLSIINTIRFVSNVELIGIQKNVLEQDIDTIKNFNNTKIIPVSRGEMLIPIYSQAAKITPSKKDVLGRKYKSNS